MAHDEKIEQELRALQHAMQNLAAAALAFGGTQAGLLTWALWRGEEVLSPEGWVVQACLFTVAASAWLRARQKALPWARAFELRLPARAWSCLPALLLTISAFSLRPLGIEAVAAHAVGALVTLVLALGGPG